MDIIFKDLKNISQKIQKGDVNTLINYLNSFEGSNIFHKFKNFLINWEYDVSPSMSLNINNKPTQISLSYIISQISDSLGDKIIIEENEFKIILDIPKTFDILVQEDIIPLYSLIHEINISGIFINLLNLSIEDRKMVVNNLPAKIYNKILKAIIDCKSTIVEFDNPVLSNFRFNFLTNEPLLFLRGLIDNFGEDYYKDVIYLLSKKIDGELLMNSTPLEIEYYIEKYSNEMESQNNGLQI